MNIFLSEKQIINQWEWISGDTYYSCPEIKTPEEFINKIKTDGVVMGGAKIILVAKIPLT